MSEDRVSLKARVPEFEKYGTKLDRAIDTVLAGGVKECRFLPSGKRLRAVGGKFGDEFVDPAKPYCSCSNFYFRVLGGREETCYHLISYMIAAKSGRVDVIEFSDEEYGPYLSATVMDVFDVLRKSG